MISFRFVRRFFTLFAAVLVSGAFSGDAATLMWTPNSETDLAGYNVYLQPQPGTLNVVDVGNTTSYSLDALAIGSYTIYVTSYSTAGLESNPSSSVLFNNGGATQIIGLSGNLAFGNVTVGSSSQRTLTITNAGNATLTVSGISYPGGFSGNWPGGTIASSGSQNVTVTFAPTAATSFGGTLTVSSDATSGPNTLAVSGTGTAPPTRIIGISGNLAFGNVAVGSTAQRTLTIANTGNDTLTVSGISYPAGFSGNWPGGTIAAGGSQNVTVTFAPTAATSFGGTLTINSDATSGANTLAVSGTGTPPPTRIIGLSGNLAFGSVTVGSTAQRTLTINNTGNATLTVSGINYPGGFSGNWPGGTVASGGSQNVTVTFAPTAATSFGGTLTVNSDATSGANTQAVSGTGTPPPTRIIGLTGNLAFGNVAVGATAQRTLTIANTGNAALTVSGITYPSGFSGNWPGGTIGVGGSQNVDVTFSPASATTFSGNIIVNSDATSGLNTLAVSGTGTITATRVVVLSGNLAFGNVAVGSTAQRTLTIANTGNSALTVSGITYPGGFSGNWPGGTIGVGGSQNVDVTFTPTSATAFGGNVTVNSDATSGVNTLAVSGTGTITVSRSIALTGNLAFGNVPVGSTAQRTLTIANTGNAALTVSGITYPSGFSGNWPGGTIGVGGSQNVDVTFTPTSATAFGGNVTVNSDAISGVNTLAVSGTGSVAATRVIALSGNLAFGNVLVGSSAQRTLTIANTGNATLTVSSIDSPTGFTGNWPGGTIPAGASQNVEITFAPGSATSFGGSLTVNSDATSGVNSLALSGTGTIAATRVIALSGNLAFGSVSVGSFAQRTLTIANTGNASLTVNALAFPNGFSGDWAGGPIPAGGSQNVEVTFAPDSVTAFGGDLTVNSDATGGVNTLALSGVGSIGNTRIIALSGNLNFGNVPAGSSSQRTLSIANTGNALLTVSGLSFPGGFSGNWPGGTIPPGGSQNVEVTFAPVSATGFSGSLTVNSDATSGSNILPVSGVGTASSARRIALGGDLNFGSVGVGFSAQRTFTIGNIGSASLTVSGISYPGGFSGDWPGGTIPPGTAQTVTVTFTPQILTLVGGVLTVHSDATGLNTLDVFGTGILAPPIITRQPENQQVISGGTVSFSVQANGTPPLSFQWRKKGDPIPGATAARFDIASVTTANADVYSVRVSNAAGFVDSAEATLTVVSQILPPTITVQPQSLSVTQGDVAIFSVLATGDEPLTYQWSKDGVPIPSATAATYMISSSVATDVGTYSVRVSNAGGFRDSTSANLVVTFTLEPPSIGGHPQNVSVPLGGSASFSVQANGTAPISYQWLKNGVPISTARAAFFTIPSVTAADAATYSVRIQNVLGSLDSSGAVLTIVATPVAPTIGQGPQSITFAEGSSGSAVFSVTASGSAPLQYQWLKDEQIIPNQTSSVLVIATVNAASAGTYRVRVSNQVDSVVSAPAQLTFIPAPRVSQEPVATLTVSEANPISLSVVATGEALEFLWFRNDLPLAEATTANLLIPSAKGQDAGSYKVRVSSRGAFVFSRAAVVSVLTRPQILSISPSSSVLQGGTVVLSVVASGAEPLRYQWKKDGNILLGAATRRVNLQDVQESDAGVYSVIVTNALGAIESSPLVLTIISLPRFTTAPASTAVSEGAPLTLQAGVVAAGNVSYQWLKGGVPIPNAHAATFVIASTGTSDAGQYTLRVTNEAGAAETPPAIITVISRPITLSIDFDVSILQLGFDGIVGKTYSLQHRLRLETGQWSNIATASPDAAGRVQFTRTLNPAESSGFFQVVQNP